MDFRGLGDSIGLLMWCMALAVVGSVFGLVFFVLWLFDCI